MKTKIIFAGALLGAMVAPGIASAGLVLDTGAPTGSSTTNLLDGTDYYAAEFNLSAGETITSVMAYLTAGLDQPGDTFTMAIYGSNLLTSRSASPLFSGQATYSGTGSAGEWDGLSGLSWTVSTTGTYWAAVEVGSADTAIGLGLPTTANNGTAPALAFASNTGSGYAASSTAFGIQVSAVPLPPALWLLGSAVLGLGAMGRRRPGRPLTAV